MSEKKITSKDITVGDRVKLKRQTHFENGEQVKQGATGVCSSISNVFISVLLDKQYRVKHGSYEVCKVTMFSDEVDLDYIKQQIEEMKDRIVVIDGLEENDMKDEKEKGYTFSPKLNVEKPTIPEYLKSLGFIEIGKSFSKIVNPKTRIPFYIRIEQSSCDDRTWNIYGKERVLVSQVISFEQLKLALLVICSFDETCFTDFSNTPFPYGY